MNLRISTLVSIGLLALLTACGGGGGGGKSSSGGGSPPPPVDTTPDGFTFTAQSNVDPAAAITSNEVTISGINTSATVAVTGGEYSIDGGTFTSAAGSVANNQRIRVRMTSSNQFTTAASATLTVGGVAGQFTTTTRVADTTPAPFQFQRQNNVTRSSVATSASVTITGIEVPVPVTISNGEYSINGGAYTAATGTVAPGQTITVRTTAGATYSRVSVVHVTVSGVSADFEITTEVPNYTPDSMAFDGEDIVFLLSNAQGLVFRWSVSGAHYVDPYKVGQPGAMPTKMAYSAAHKRLYFGYDSGVIRYVNCATANPVEVGFASIPMSVQGLASAGKYLVAQDFSGAWATHYIFDAAGALTQSADWNYYSREYAWDAASSRLYFLRDNMSPNDLHYEVIDQTTGLISGAGETPYHGSYYINTPIRVSQNGSYVLLGSGDLYKQADLTWAGSLGGQIFDARWMADGSIVTLSVSGSQTTLRRLSAAKTTLELIKFTGQQPRVFGSDTSMVVVVVNGPTVQFKSYVPSNDSDGDGVSNTTDAFPLDPAASVDVDHDGYPDAWNAGRTQADSTTGLTLDAFPNDAACWLAAHGSGGVCNYGATIPNYTPDQIAQNGDVVYLLSSANQRVYRWSIATGQYLNPYVVGINQGSGAIAPTRMAFSPAHKRLYLGYASGQIQYLDTTSNTALEVPFANTAMAVGGLAAVGNFVLAADGSGAWATHYIFDAAGAIKASADWNYYSREYAWDPVTSRVYFFRDDTSPNDLHYEVIDQTTGAIAGAGETPYHGAYYITPPIRVTTDGQHVLLGSGDIYARNGLTWERSLGTQIADARWFDNQQLVTLTTSGNYTALRRLGAPNPIVQEQLTYAGQALRVVGSDTKMVVLTLDNGSVQFYSYVPNDDSDGDGVINTQDAFPLDAAASVDSDHDGYPDAWNAGKSQADSTTGLVLDAFPNDAACWLSSHGSGGLCDYGATIPSFVPDQVVQNGDVVYLLSSANKRIYRRSISTGKYLNPYIAELDQGLGTLAPTVMAVSPAHNRVYLGYSTGAIRFIDIAGNGGQVQFANLAMGVRGLASVGNYLLAQDPSGAWATHYVLDSGGAIRSQREFNFRSSEYAWDAATSRVYYFRDDTSPNDLQYEVIDQATGAITSAGETPYHGTYNIIAPIRVSANSQHILLGSGDIYAQADLTWEGSLGARVDDARWLADGTLITLTTSGSQSIVRHVDSATLAVYEQRSYAGTALRIVGSDAAMVIMSLDAGAIRYGSYVPSTDTDADGVLNAADAFPMDVAASIDTDHDGHPNAWNAGKSQADSTTGLTLDSFPNDAECWAPAHGSGGVCNYAATMPAYTPDQVVQQGDVIYLLSTVNKRVYRRSISGAKYLKPYVVGAAQGFNTIAPVTMAISAAHHRLYLGYPTGAVRYFDVNLATPTETAFVNTGSWIYGLTSAGNYLLVHSVSGPVYDVNGVMTSSGVWSGSSRDFTWDPVTSREYFFRDGYSPNDLQYTELNATTGQVTGNGETPYHGAYNIDPPIRVSADGQHVLLGSGDLYFQNGLVWEGSLGSAFTDGRWFANGTLATLTTGSNQTVLRRLASGTFTTLEQLSFAGTALRIVGTDAAMVVLTMNNGTVQFYNYVPNDDVDGDGVTNVSDAFPLDPAASVDTDHDGYPNAWNVGKSQADSTTGLTLDAFPNDSACWLSSHGSGGVCNFGATMPNYTPDEVLTRGNVVYLLSRANNRVYRWSMATGQYLNPYIVGINQGFATLPPSKMAYSPAHNRLYLGYETGAIHYLDATSNTPVETAFANTAMGLGGLASVGNYVLAQDYSGAWAAHSVFDSAGVRTDWREWNYVSNAYAWDAGSSRVYFFRQNMTPTDLHFEVIDQTNGHITSAGETPYHGDFQHDAPLRVSSNGQRIIDGPGDIYSRDGLVWQGNIGPIKDARWTDDALLDVTTADKVEIRDPVTRAVLQSYQYTGIPIAIVTGTSETYLVHVLNGTASFLRLPFYDQDADTMPRWWEQLYGLNDANGGDATADPDGDGISNAAEYANHTNPTLADTDGDGLTDAQEINTYHTSPVKADTDGDGLKDQAEVVTHHTDPLDADSDNDGYTDFEEVLYGGNPNDPSGLPQPLTTYTQNFEGTPNLMAWSLPTAGVSLWTISAISPHGGAASYMAGPAGIAQSSSTKFHGYFSNGTVSFWARVESEGCCDRLEVYVDGNYMTFVNPNLPWNNYSVPVSAGIHDVEWRYHKDYYPGSGVDAAWIDDVVFTAQ